jgi:hypothetical protein
MRKAEYSLIGIVAVFTAIVLPVFNEGHAMDFGNTSDIVSAVCNIAMASAAVYAAFTARDWLTAKKKESSLPLVAEFHNQHIMPLKLMVRNTLCGIEIADNEIRLFRQADELAELRNPNPSESVAKHINTNIEWLENSYKNYKNFYMEDVVKIRASENKLMLHGWKLHNEKKYKELIKQKTDFFELTLATLRQVDQYYSILYSRKMIQSYKYYAIDDDSILSNREIFDSIKENIPKLQKLEEMINITTKELNYNIWI